MHSRFVALIALASLAFLTGCASSPWDDWPKRYYRVRVTNPTGELVADWIAEGYVKQTEHGYRFRAVERHTGGRYPQHRRYPHGRMMEVGGPNITVARAGEPYWRYLERQGQGSVTTTTTTEVTTETYGSK